MAFSHSFRSPALVLLALALLRACGFRDPIVGSGDGVVLTGDGISNRPQPVGGSLTAATLANVSYAAVVLDTGLEVDW